MFEIMISKLGELGNLHADLKLPLGSKTAAQTLAESLISVLFVLMFYELFLPSS